MTSALPDHHRDADAGTVRARRTCARRQAGARCRFVGAARSSQRVSYALLLSGVAPVDRTNPGARGAVLRRAHRLYYPRHRPPDPSFVALGTNPLGPTRRVGGGWTGLGEDPSEHAGSRSVRELRPEASTLSATPREEPTGASSIDRFGTERRSRRTLLLRTLTCKLAARSSARTEFPLPSRTPHTRATTTLRPTSPHWRPARATAVRARAPGSHFSCRASASLAVVRCRAIPRPWGRATADIHRLVCEVMNRPRE
jgi:hypothetical protein